MKLLGIKATKMTTGRNQGKTGFTYYFEKDFTDYEKENSVCYGVSICQEFSYTDFGIAVGEYVEPVYDKGFQDKAVLVNLIPFKPPVDKASGK